MIMLKAYLLRNLPEKLCYRLNRCVRSVSVTHKKCDQTFRPYSTRPIAPAWNVLFFGTDDFSAESLTALCNEMKLLRVVGHLEVVTSTKSRKPNPVQRIAQQENLAVHPWPLESVPPGFHIGLVASFGHLIPKKIIEMFPLGVLNVHASLLPRWRGAAPIVYAVLNGDTKTGVSIMQIMPHRFDVGPVLKQMACPIGPHETAADVQTRLARLGAEALLEVVRHLPHSLDDAWPQLEDGVTYAPKVTPALYRADWHKMAAADVYNLCRALGHVTSNWYGTAVRLAQPDAPSSAPSPVSHLSSLPATAIPGGDVASSRTPRRALSTESFTGQQFTPGMVRIHRASAMLRVMCVDGSWLAFAKVTIIGKKPMSAIDFYNGFLSKVPLDEWILT
ncbi:methionyl-tRNA formyltransferase, mitochondrial-like isoform X1 [Schistocerca gregaria]|uniref:methionyl-tRNA formyltransferase, mitochondrial-like isoform X1 n=1 Tax=Schistocerca gregaria TaxID=7010 RepID=UPI00211ED1FD|nr:methionyl-tRNA formyltransferase, mitochondrial-like isoform X1 [Schistocerca gregaria]